MLLFSTEFDVFAWLLILSSNFIYAHIIMHTDIKYVLLLLSHFYLSHTHDSSQLSDVNKSDEKWCEYNMCQSEYRF